MTRCVDGRLMRADPQPDDPYLETDIGRCPDCDGKSCDPAAWSDLIEQLNFGDIGDVEFTELALDAGMSIERIGRELEAAREEF